MIVTLTREQMLECRRRAAGLGHLRTDCSLTLNDGIDMDAIFEDELRQWYLDLLDNGPRHLVAASDVVASVRSGAQVPGDGVAVEVAPSCRRVFEICLDGWLAPVEVVAPDKARDVINRQLNPYTAATQASPAACMMPGAEAGTVGTVLAWPAGKLPRVWGAVDTGPELYTFDEAAMNTIFDKKSVVRDE